MLYKLPILLVITSVISLPLIFQLYVYLYFNSRKFNELKPSISNFIKSCNELNHHIAELKGAYVDVKSFDYGSRAIKEESEFNYRRTEWSKNVKIQCTSLHCCFF
jgi:hypothetical protein